MNYEKLMELNRLNQGDKVKLTDGRIAVFVRNKQKNFVGTMNGGSYNIPKEMYLETVERVDLNSKIPEINELKENELFYIFHNGHSLLYKFKGIQGKKILAECPVSKTMTRIDYQLYSGKVSNLL